MTSRISIVAFALAFACSTAGAATIGFSGPGIYRFVGNSPPPAIAPWEYVVDVNGTEHSFASTGYAFISILQTDGEFGEPFINPGLWRQSTTAELAGFHDGSRFKIVAYPSARRRASGIPRIYTTVYRWTGDGIGDNFGFNALDASFHRLGIELTEPMILQNVEQLTPNDVLLEGLYGPRWTADVVLFDEIVGGERFTVRLKEVGFGAWPTIIAHNVIPEPSGLVLVLVSVVGLLVGGRRR